jgi:hypothetical protein
MARREQAREDLLRDAKALVPRLQLRVPSPPLPDEVVVAGWRGDALSLFFGEDPAYHFNSEGRLRRGFIGGSLVKAEREQLVVLQRRRSSAGVELLAATLAASAADAMLRQIALHCDALRAALQTGRSLLVGEFPPQSGAVERLESWLACRPEIRAARHARVE